MAKRGTKREQPRVDIARGSLSELFELVDGIETAMMTTRRADGMLVSRPMANQKRAAGADFWFVTAEGMDKLDEIAADPRVNLAYYRDRTREWVSVSGVAEISRDRATIRKLYARDWKAWFPDEGGDRNGGPDDPRFVLIGVQARSAHYMRVNKPQPLLLFEFVRGMVTGQMPEFGEVKEVSRPRPGRARAAAATASRTPARTARGSASRRKTSSARSARSTRSRG